MYVIDNWTVFFHSVKDGLEGLSSISILWASVEQIEEAVNGLRAAGTVHHVPRGLLARAVFRYLSADPTGSRRDLDEAYEIARRGPMPLHQVDILLTRVRLFGRELAAYPWGSPRDDLAEARRLIEKHGYHRRGKRLRMLRKR